MPTLEDSIEKLKALHELRGDAADLHAKAIKYLSSDGPRDEVRIDDDGDVTRFVGNATQLRALQHVRPEEGSTDLRERRVVLLERLNRLKPAMLLPTISDISRRPRTSGEDSPHEHLPLFTAARVFLALVSVPGQALQCPGLYCYYTILRAFYTATPPEFTSGGVRAGDRGRATAYMTGECAYALVELQHSLIRTAEVLERIGVWKEATDRARHERIPRTWGIHEQRRATNALRVDVLVRRRDLAFDPSGLESMLDCHDEAVLSISEEAIRNAIVTAIETNLAAFGVAIRECCKAREPERSASPSPRDAERTESAHLTASRGLESGMDATRTILAAITDLHWEKAATTLRAEANRVQKILQAAESYLMSVLDRELARSASQEKENRCDYPELAFAAAGYGRLVYGEFRRDRRDTEWDDPRLKRAALILAEGLAFNGRFPPGRPIAVTRRGYRLDIIGAQITRAVAEILRNADVAFAPSVVRAMLRLFWDTQDPDKGGFGHEENATIEPELWTTALCALALECVVDMLNHTIRHEVTKHFKVRWPRELKVSLDTVMHSDVGLSVQTKRPSCSEVLERLRDHILGLTTKQPSLFSLILYGPPGTGKTTIVEALAASTDCPLIEITPSDLIEGGQDQVERRARIVFDALSMISDSVILFDEFDSVLRQRRPGQQIINIFEFLTPGMLPKLKALNDAAGKRRVAYVLTTNLIGDLDDAAIRDGRFDFKLGIYPPDVLSRAGRLISEVIRFNASRKVLDALDSRSLDRIATVVGRTARGGMTKIGKPGWLTAPKKENPGPKTPFRFIETGNASDLPDRVESEKEWCEAKPQAPNGSTLTEWREWGWVEDWDKNLDDDHDISWSELQRALATPPLLRA